MGQSSTVLVKGIPAFVGLGLGLLGILLFKNEKNLLIRKLELEKELKNRQSKYTQKIL